MSVSLPVDLVKAVKALADERGETRSAIVADAIRRVMREERNREITRQLLMDERERREQESLSNEPFVHPNLGTAAIRERLPTATDLRGLATGMTGGLSSDEYVRQNRETRWSDADAVSDSLAYTEEVADEAERERSNS